MLFCVAPNTARQCLSILLVYTVSWLVGGSYHFLVSAQLKGLPAPSHKIGVPASHRSTADRQRRSISPFRGLPMFRYFQPPSFDPSVPLNITTQLGQTVYLHCAVRNLGDKTVSWIRRRDFHVLTVGLTTYTTDSRFQASHLERSDDWMLQIKLVQLADAGIYECQVNTHPLISLFILLTVVVPKAVVREAPDLYVKTGSAINLTCVISQSPEPPVFVFWYHDDRMINYDSSRGKIIVQKSNNDTAISRLIINNAQIADSGNYTCCPSNADASSVSVHVLNGEKRAAMQHDVNAAPVTSTGCTVNTFSTSVLVLPVFFLSLS